MGAEPRSAIEVFGEGEGWMGGSGTEAALTGHSAEGVAWTNKCLKKRCQNKCEEKPVLSRV